MSLTLEQYLNQCIMQMTEVKPLDSEEELLMMQHYVLYIKNSNMSSTEDEERMLNRACADNMLLSSYRIYQRNQQRQRRQRQ